MQVSLPKQLKKSTATKTAATFSLKQLVMAYNDHFQNADVPEKFPRITFKVFDKDTLKDKKRGIDTRDIIKLSDFEGVTEFEDEYKRRRLDGEHLIKTEERDRKGNVIEHVTEMSEDDYIEHLTNDFIYNMTTRACLSMVNEFSVRPKATKDCPNPANPIFENLIPQLKFVPRKDVNAQSYIKAITSLLTSNAMKIKAFNTIFPLGTYKEETNEKARAVNTMYIQVLPRFYNAILHALIKEKKSDEAIYKLVQKTLATEATDLQLKYQILDSVLTGYYVNGFPTVQQLDEKTQETVEVPDTKWIQHLHVVRVEDKKLVQTTEEISKDVQKGLEPVIRELNATRVFLRKLHAAEKASTAVVTMEEALEKFTARCDKLDAFVTAHDSMGVTFLDFARLLLAVHNFLKDEFELDQPLKLISAQLNEHSSFKFTKDFRDKFTKMLEAPTSGERELLLQEVADYCEQHIRAISVIKSRDFLDADLEIYSSIGRFVKIPSLERKHRIALGIAIVKFINERLENIISRHDHHRDITVYMRE